MTADRPRITTANDLRRAWTEFFASREHTLVPSASLIPPHPSAPMFTNSGMMPFVPYFLGEEPVPFRPPRATSVQKCVRAGGKHNDLDAIGRSPAPPLVLRDARQLQLRRLLQGRGHPVGVGVRHRGARPRRRPPLGHRATSPTTRPRRSGPTRSAFPRERIQRLDKDNFWEMGETGPCGPSLGDLLRLRPRARPRRRPGEPRRPRTATSRSGTSSSRSTSADADGSLTDLPTRERRHRRRPRAHPRRAGGQPVAVLGRRAGAPGRRGAVGHRVTASARTTLSDIALRLHRRPRPHDDVPRRRRRHPVQRGPRLRAAPHHPPGRPLRLPARRRAAGAARRWSSSASTSWATPTPSS